MVENKLAASDTMEFNFIRRLFLVVYARSRERARAVYE